MTMKIHTKLIKFGEDHSEDFARKLSRARLDGWDIISSGYSAPCWWAILQTEEEV